MYCPKQGLRHFKVELYEGFNGEKNDFTSKPRPCNNLAYILSGNAVFEENGKEITVSAGEYIFIAKGCEYRSRWYGTDSVRFITIQFDFEWQNDPLKNKIIKIQTIKGNNTSESKMRYLYEHQNDTGSESFAFLGTFYLLCAETISQLKYVSVSKKSAVQPALDYLEANFDKKVSVKYLASLCFLSEAHFYTCFKNEIGTSPIDYKNRLCIRHTMHTLVSEPKMSIEDIAEAYGFESAVYFRRLFKSITGKTPSEYRKSEILM